MNQISTELLDTQNLVNFEIDKDTWIYTYGSHQLQEVRSFGYECEERYQQERLNTEYPSFKINHRSTSQKLDFPPLYAIQESLKWQNAYVAKQIIDGEVIAIDNYLGKYQIIKKTCKPWYLIVCTEQLLLGSIRVDKGNASKVLANLGVDSTKIRAQVLRMLGETTEVSTTSKSSAATAQKTDITILLRSIETKTIAIDRTVNALKEDIAALRAAIEMTTSN